MDNSSGHKIYEFGDFRLDCRDRMLYRAGVEVNLSPKAVETLIALVDRRGQIVSKDELLTSVWPDTSVEESNLYLYLSLLRKTLGTKLNGKPWIETLRRRGYRFNAGAKEIGYPQLNTADISRAEVAPVIEKDSELEQSGTNSVLADQSENHLIARQTGGGNLRAPSTAERATPIGPKQKTAPLVLFGLLISLSAVSAIYWHWSESTKEVVGKEPPIVVRLTNGIFPYDATISSDGRYFVYHEINGDLYRMWLQKTGHFNRIEVIPATQQVLSVKSFTPDGKFIYYVASDRDDRRPSLYRVPTLGGSPTKILTGIDSPVSFAPDGRAMVFSRYDEQERKVSYAILNSEGGGAVRVLIKPEIDQYVCGNPAWSPDGKTIVGGFATPANGTKPTCELVAIPVSGGEPVSISEGWGFCYRIEWRRDGSGIYLIGTRESDSYTPRRDQVYFVGYPGGKFRKISSEDSRHQPTSLGVTNDGSVLAVPFNRSSQIWTMIPHGDPGEAVQLTSGLADGRSGLASLPDGRIAYIARTGESQGIWSINADGSDPRQITVDPPFVEELRSGGDGRYLVFSAPQGPFNHLFRINYDGTGMRQLTFGESFEVDSSISNDGRWVAYTSAIKSGTNLATALWKLPIDGGEPIFLNRGDCSRPHFSPNDKLISCIRNEKEVLILSADDGTLISSLATMPRAVLNFGAIWTRDGRALMYIVNENNEQSNLWYQPVESGTPKRLTEFTGGSIYRFALSLDGARLYLARGQQIHDAILINDSMRD